MAIVTAVNRPRGQTRGGLRAVLRYVMKEEKTADQDRHLVTGVNCQADSCCTEFISTKLQYGKDNGRMYYHFVQSFHPEEPVTRRTTRSSWPPIRTGSTSTPTSSSTPSAFRAAGSSTLKKRT